MVTVRMCKAQCMLGGEVLKVNRCGVKPNKVHCHSTPSPWRSPTSSTMENVPNLTLGLGVDHTDSKPQPPMCRTVLKRSLGLVWAVDSVYLRGISSILGLYWMDVHRLIVSPWILVNYSAALLQLERKEKRYESRLLGACPWRLVVFFSVVKLLQAVTAKLSKPLSVLIRFFLLLCDTSIGFFSLSEHEISLTHKAVVSIPLPQPYK